MDAGKSLYAMPYAYRRWTESLPASFFLSRATHNMHMHMHMHMHMCMSHVQHVHVHVHVSMPRIVDRGAGTLKICPQHPSPSDRHSTEVRWRLGFPWVGQLQACLHMHIHTCT